MHVTSDYYRSRVHRIAACSSGAQGSSHASASLNQEVPQAHGLCRPLCPSARTLQRLAFYYKKTTVSSNEF